MAIPPEFNEVEHIQSVTRRYLNRQVREDFQDLGGDDWEPETGTTRGAMRHALTHKDTDPLPVTLSRMFLYYFTYQKAQALQAPVYGLPVTTFHDAVKFHPQVRLYFCEGVEDVEEGFTPVEAEVTFRLVRETSATITPGEAKSIATRIKTNFASGNGFTWKKGKEKWLYFDAALGYDFRLLAFSEAEARKVIEQVLDISNHTPDWDNLGVATKKKTFPTMPGTHTVYGKSRRKPRERPTATVRFRYAELKVWGLPNDITLVDRTGFRHNPLISV